MFLSCNTEILTFFFLKGFERGKEDISQNKDESSLSMSKSKVSLLSLIHNYGIFLKYYLI
jgi:hypothetical protein